MLRRNTLFDAVSLNNALPTALAKLTGVNNRPDTSYATRGWLHDAGTDVQQRVHDSFLQTLAGLQRVPVDKAPWLERRDGAGNTADWPGGANTSNGEPTIRFPTS